MAQTGLHTTIIELASLYDTLNKRWENDTCRTDVYQVYRQEEYHDCYEKLKIANIESIILEILASSLNEKILTRLRTGIENNIRIYKTRQTDFDGIDFHTLCQFDEEHQFSEKLKLLKKDREDIQEYPYPTEQERNMLLKENQQEINRLQNERSDYIRSRRWIEEDYYTRIVELSQSSLSIINSYFPGEEEKETVLATLDESKEEPAVESSTIDPDVIFRSRMYDKFLLLELKLITDNYLNKDLYWIHNHKNNRTDVKSLVIFLTGLVDNNYFLPNRDPKIKLFFENRYQIRIGQNFEKKRRESCLSEYKAVFYDYPF
jgi:hypothetical protein